MPRDWYLLVCYRLRSLARRAAPYGSPLAQNRGHSTHGLEALFNDVTPGIREGSSGAYYSHHPFVTH